MIHAERIRLVAEGLVGPHRKIYLNNPYFRYAILLYAEGIIKTIDNSLEQARNAEAFLSSYDNLFTGRTENGPT